MRQRQICSAEAASFQEQKQQQINEHRRVLKIKEEQGLQELDRKMQVKLEKEEMERVKELERQKAKEQKYR